MSRILIVFASAAFQGGRARDGLDAALAAIAFDHEVGVLFIHNGVNLLASAPEPKPFGLPDLGRGLGALIHHGAQALAASDFCMQARGIKQTSIAVERLDANALKNFIGSYQHVHSF